MSADADRRRWAARVLVGAQVALLLALVRPTRPHARRSLVWAGRLLSCTGVGVAAAAAAGLGESLTPSPMPTAGGRLQRAGLYARVRHPLYGGLLLFAAGRAVTGTGKMPALLALVGLLTGKARWEEALLAERFPDYAAYREVTGRFLPAWRR